MAVYTITLLELASTMSSGSVIDRQKFLEEWLFNSDVGLDEELYSKFKKIFITKYLFSEIGYETPALFRDRLLSDLYAKSDYYNQLWKLNKILMEWDFMEDDIMLKTDEQHKASISENEELGRKNKSEDQYSGSKNVVNNEQSVQENSLDESADSEKSGEQSQNTNVEHNNKGQIVDVTHNEKLVQTEGNNATADFPQSINIANKDYWSRGDKQNQQEYNMSEDTNTRTLDDGYNQNSGANSHQTESGTNQLKNTSVGNMNRDFMDESTEQTSRSVQEVLEDIISKIIQEDRGTSGNRKGRMQRRQVPEVISMITNQYISVPEQISIDMGHHFMSIW